jgi:hypothetical protein
VTFFAIDRRFFEWWAMILFFSGLKKLVHPNAGVVRFDG